MALLATSSVCPHFSSQSFLSDGSEASLPHPALTSSLSPISQSLLSHSFHHHNAINRPSSRPPVLRQSGTRFRAQKRGHWTGCLRSQACKLIVLEGACPSTTRSHHRILPPPPTFLALSVPSSTRSRCFFQAQRLWSAVGGRSSLCRPVADAVQLLLMLVASPGMPKPHHLHHASLNVRRTTFHPHRPEARDINNRHQLPTSLPSLPSLPSLRHPPTARPSIQGSPAAVAGRHTGR